MPCEAVGVILAPSGTSFARWEDQYLVTIGGIPVLHRLRHALIRGGAHDVLILTSPDASVDPPNDHIACSPDDAAHAKRVADRLAAWADGRVVLFVRGDRPLLSADTISEVLARCPEKPVDAVYGETGAICAVRSPQAAADLLPLLHRAGLALPADRMAVEAAETGWRIDVFPSVRPGDGRCLTSPEDLAGIDRMARAAKASHLIRSGVRILDPERTVIDDTVTVDRGTTLLPGSYLAGDTHIGEDCVIGPDVWIENARIKDRCTVRYSVIEGASIDSDSAIGPYAHLRRGAEIGQHVRVGNFVEVKAARLERGVKAGHLSYLGDAQVGEGTNIGAGTITCNYDGEEKHRTVIGKEVFVGSHASLVAPVTIGDGALIAAGSTITEDVPARAKAFGRARQVVKRQADESEGEER